jgi:cytochrome b6-f complex iron-sulfur subunit
MNPLYADIPTVPLVLGVGALVVLVLITLVAAAKRRDTQDATGVLSHETRKKDTALDTTALADGPTGKEIERIADAERRGVSLEPATTTTELAPFVPPDPETIGVARRQFLNRSIVVLFGFALSMFGVQVIAFLWPQPKGGFGSKINVGKIEDIQQKITAASGFYYVAEGRMWITAYPTGSIDKAKAVYSDPVLNAMAVGLSPLYQKCPHLGCRVPSCVSSKWFECPCHGSQYNMAGEKKGGPAPRGMDRFATEVTGGSLIVNTGLVVQGPPVGTNTTGQEAEGPHCVGGGGH